MLTPLEAVQPSLIGRYVEVLWPDDGTWWKAKVTHLVPGTGMATRFYGNAATEKKEEGADAAKSEERAPAAGAPAAAAEDGAAPMDTDAPTPAPAPAPAPAPVDEEDPEGEIEELNLQEAATNNEVSWHPDEVERVKREYEALLSQTGPIAPADKAAVPCPHCDKREFKYLRSMEKHCWNDHGVRISREEMETFERQLRAGRALLGPRPPRPGRRYNPPPELITINYDDYYNILDSDDAIKERAIKRVETTKAAMEISRKAGGPEGQRATLWSAMERDLCHICGEADPDFWGIEGDLIVMCDGCDEQAHLSCYGLTEVPEGDWFCQGCVDGVKVGPGMPDDSGMCALCPVPGGVLARVQPPSRWATDWGADGSHAHLCCASSLSEVAVTPSTTCAPVIDMSRVKNSRMALMCGLCGLAGGCVQCSMKNCFQGFHVLCARAAGLEHLYADKEAGDPAIFFCAEHSAPAFAIRRLKSAGLVAATGAATQAAPGDKSNAENPDGATDNEMRLAANFEMKMEGLKTEERKAIFVVRLWHRFVPFLPQPADPARRADLMKRSGKYAMRVMVRAKIPEKEMNRLAALTDAQGEAEVKDTHDAATKLALNEAKKGDHLNAGLRPYQREGVAWLAAQHAAGAGGGILGDDMGLGKTLQCLSFLQYLRDAKNESGPHLVVCPLSVLPTWVQEAKRWCPSLRAVAFHGPEAERNRLKEEVLIHGTFDVLVTTYEMLTAEQSMLAARFHFRYLILDEAQRVKNDASLVSHAVRRVRAASALLLTGTPLQNNLHELRALVSVLFQDVLEAAGAEKMESDGAAAFGDDTAVAAARSLLQPLMLRRTKAAVLSKDLPPKTETVVRIPLSENQREWYKILLENEKGLFGKLATTNATSEKEALDNGRCIAEQSALDAGDLDEEISEEAEEDIDIAAAKTPGMKKSQSMSEVAPAKTPGTGGRKGGSQQFTKLNNLLMQLRKVCCHPFLFGDEAVHAAVAKHGGDRVEALIAASGKLTALDEMLPKLHAGGHKVLIFSQFSMMLDVLEEFCEARGHAHLRCVLSHTGPHTTASAW
jgi:SWI/SNF-related matrix-associated actin-dependent regulator of chromatin subfamily A member 5